MAATITDIGNATDAAGTNATFTDYFTVAVGDWLVAIVANSNNASAGAATGITQVSLIDDAIATVFPMTNRVSIVYDPGAAGEGAVLAIATVEVTAASALAYGHVQFSTTMAQSALQVYRVRPASGEVVEFVAADATGSISAATLHSAATVEVTNGRIIFGAASIETNDAVTGDSDTANGSWSTVITRLADGGSDALAQSCVSQYKTVNATGNQSWACSTTSSRDSARSYLVLNVNATAKTIDAAAGSYALAAGSDVNFRKGRTVIPDAAGAYALSGTAATLTYSGLNKTIAAEVGSYSLLGPDATLTHSYKLDATTAGSYALTGTDAILTKTGIKSLIADAGSYGLTGSDAVPFKTTATAKIIIAESGVYVLTGTDPALLHAWRIAAGDETTGGDLLLETGDDLLLETGDSVLLEEDSLITGGTYALTGSDVALSTAANKVILADAGSYLLTGTDASLTTGVAPPAVSTLHIGEWPVDKRRRRRREDAAAAEQRARKRFRDAIGRLLEGLPPEFDEPADLDEALDSAVQASNLLYALSAPIREINAVNELIDHIRQLRIAQPIAQLAMAQAYNRAHRHLVHKAQEDVVMALLLGE